MSALVVSVIFGGSFFVALAYLLFVKSDLHATRDTAIDAADHNHDLRPGFHRPDVEVSVTDVLQRVEHRER